MPLTAGVQLGTYAATCPVCRLPHLSLHLGRTGPDRPFGEARLERAGGGGALQVVTSGRAEAVSIILDRLGRRALWTTGVPLNSVADSTLLRAAAWVCGALLLPTRAQALDAFVALASSVAGQQRGSFCRHALVVDDYLCTAFVLTGADERVDQVGILSLEEWLSEEPAPELPEQLLPVPTMLLEAAPDEPALSVEELYALDQWETITCEAPRPRRPWQHLIFVSHRWPSATCPGSEEDLEAIKVMVRNHIAKKLDEFSRKPDPRIKTTKESDFAVWIDFMMVPNRLDHRGAAPCPDCVKLKDEAIQRINALLTLSTVLSHTPGEDHRGWILQEVTLNTHVHTHGGKLLAHRDRVRLMQQSVAFTDSFDGARLRCYEFIRLGQTPRVWPAVNIELLDCWAREGEFDESTRAAWATLTHFARSFDEPCHRLKKAMAKGTQALAIWKAGGAPFNLAPLAAAVHEQSRAMEELAGRIADDERDGDPGDPEGLLKGRMNGARRSDLARGLQILQFIHVALGLRSEAHRQAGVAAWVHVSALTDALTGAKFMARLRGGRIRFWPATSEATLRPEGPRAAAARFEFAADTLTLGVRADVLLAV